MTVRRLPALIAFVLAVALAAGQTWAKLAPPRFEAAAPYSATARVDADKPGRKISDGIYGVCGLPREKLIDYQIEVTRWGGNPSTRYNWKLGVDNGTADWYFKSRGDLLQRPTDTGWLKIIESNQAIGATTYQTVPMIGWVAKDASSYGFSVAKYGPQKGAGSGHPDVGNGVKPDGSNVTGNDPKDTSVEAPPEFIAEGVRLVVKRAGRADGSDGSPGVKYWALDNEPMLWNSTHRDVHPQPLSYDELWERTVKYAEAIESPCSASVMPMRSSGAIGSTITSVPSGQSSGSPTTICPYFTIPLMAFMVSSSRAPVPSRSWSNRSLRRKFGTHGRGLDSSRPMFPRPAAEVKGATGRTPGLFPSFCLTPDARPATMLGWPGAHNAVNDPDAASPQHPRLRRSNRSVGGPLSPLPDRRPLAFRTKPDFSPGDNPSGPRVV